MSPAVPLLCSVITHSPTGFSASAANDLWAWQMSQLPLLFGPSAGQTLMVNRPMWFSSPDFLPWLARKAGAGLVSAGLRAKGAEEGDMSLQNDSGELCGLCHWIYCSRVFVGTP
jgi:hypothetical protein